MLIRMVGGTLRVRHRGQKVDFAWGNGDPCSIQGAAFYGDCEHEVLEVRKGHRITLTYNLYYSLIGQLARPVSDPNHLPLYSTISNILRDPAFMQRGKRRPFVLQSLTNRSYDGLPGGTLGFFCHHQYAHSTEYGSRSIPAGFKGVDLAIFSVFISLGLKVGVHPIVQNKTRHQGGMPVKRLFRESTNQDGAGTCSDHVQEFLDRLKGIAMEQRDRESDSISSEEIAEYDYLQCEPVHGFGTEVEDYDEGPEEWITTVGTKLHRPTFDPVEDEQSREVRTPTRLNPVAKAC